MQYVLKRSRAVSERGTVGFSMALCPLRGLRYPAHPCTVRVAMSTVKWRRKKSVSLTVLLS
jgi:hypothetical protein